MPLRKVSFTLSGHRTSVALEGEFWEVLRGVAEGRGVTLAGLVAGIDAERAAGETLASSLRLAALRAALTCGKAFPGDPASR